MIDAAIKDKLKKLFRVAENDASTDGEIDNAMRAAKILMARHQIERDDIFDGEDEVDVTKVTYGQMKRYSMYTSTCAWENWLCQFLMEFVPGLGVYVRTGTIRRNAVGMAVGNKRATEINFYGAELDVQFAVELFDEIVYFIQAAATLRFGAALARGAAAAYAEGFCRSLHDSNKREQTKLVANKDCYALAVINRDLAIRKGAKTWLAEQGVHLGRSRKTSYSSNKFRNADAYAQGQRDGKGYSPASTRKSGYLT